MDFEQIERRPQRPGQEPLHYLPTPAEIRAACREIQAGWSSAELDRRRRGEASEERPTSSDRGCVMADTPILFVDKALTETELRRLETELQAFTEAGAGAALVVVESIELTEADSLTGLADLLEHPPAGLTVAVLLAGRIGRELGSRLLALELPAFVTPRAKVETANPSRRSVTAIELDLTGLATLVRSPRHAADRLRAMAMTPTA